MSAKSRPEKVTIIPADRLIAVDGEALTFDYPAPPDLHALHWNGTTVSVERISTGGIMDNARYSAAYDVQVAPFVALWLAEKDRLTAEANKPPPPPTLAEKAAHLATVRWQAEQGGTVWGDYTVATDDRSQSKYLAELAAIDQGVRVDPSPWKLSRRAGLGGDADHESYFALLSNADIKAMSIAARAHVMACFAAEAAVQSNLDSLPTLDAITTAFTAALAQIKDHTP